MIEISIIIPCRNEEKSLGAVIRSAQEAVKENKYNAEIIVSDSSTDSSPKIARKLNVKLVKHDKKGYGIACREGINAAIGKYVVIGDADGTYDFSEMPKLISKLRQGYDLVLGNRLQGKIEKGAMKPLHRYIGNPGISKLISILFKTKISDTQSGFRAASRKSLKSLNLMTTGMEFASEMVIKAGKARLKIGEVPITYKKRKGESKLNSLSDGWRHFRFMLMFSPTFVFLVPGALLLISGVLSFLASFFSHELLFSLFGLLLSVVGYQTILIGLHARIYAIHAGFEKEDKLIDTIARNIPLERGLLIGLGVAILGAVLVALPLLLRNSLPVSMIGATIIIIGIQMLFSAFFISMMAIEKLY